MKRLYLEKLSVRLGIALTLAVAVFIIHSCRKDQKTSVVPATLSSSDLSQLQAIYSKGIVSGSGLVTASLGSNSFPGFVHNLNVKWDKYVINNRSDNSQVVEFDMQADSDLIVTRQPKAGEPIYYKNKTSAVFIKLNNGTQLNFFMKVIEDYTQTHNSVIGSLHYRQIPVTFTGLIIFYTLDRKFINGFRYYNGRAVAPLNGTKAGSGSKLQVNSTGKAVNVAQPTGPDPGDCGGATVTYDLSLCTYDPSVQGYWCTIDAEVDYVPDDPCSTDSGDPDPGVTGDPTSSGSSTTPPPPVDTLSKIVAGYCDGVSDTQKQEILNALATFKNENCVQKGIYGNFFNTSIGITFCINDALDNNGHPIAGGANVANISITFQDGSVSATMDEELYHLYQNSVYTGGRLQYTTNGRADIEFEAKLFNDIVNPPSSAGALYQSTANASAAYNGDLTAYNTDVSAYRDWLNTVTNNGSYYPKSMSDVNQTQYTRFLNIFSNLNPQDGAPVNVAPQAIFKSFRLYGCQ